MLDLHHGPNNHGALDGRVSTPTGSSFYFKIMTSLGPYMVHSSSHSNSFIDNHRFCHCLQYDQILGVLHKVRFEGVWFFRLKTCSKRLDFLNSLPNPSI